MIGAVEIFTLLFSLGILGLAGFYITKIEEKRERQLELLTLFSSIFFYSLAFAMKGFPNPVLPIFSQISFIFGGTVFSIILAFSLLIISIVPGLVGYYIFWGLIMVAFFITAGITMNIIKRRVHESILVETVIVWVWVVCFIFIKFLLNLEDFWLVVGNWLITFLLAFIKLYRYNLEIRSINSYKVEKLKKFISWKQSYIVELENAVKSIKQELEEQQVLCRKLEEELKGKEREIENIYNELMEIKEGKDQVVTKISKILEELNLDTIKGKLKDSGKYRGKGEVEEMVEEIIRISHSLGTSGINFLQTVLQGEKHIKDTVNYSETIKKDIENVKRITEDLKLLIQKAKIISINIAIEASKVSGTTAFRNIAEDIRRLSEEVKNYVSSIIEIMGSIYEKVTLIISTIKTFTLTFVELETVSKNIRMNVEQMGKKGSELVSKIDSFKEDLVNTTLSQVFSEFEGMKKAIQELYELEGKINELLQNY